MKKYMLVAALAGMMVLAGQAWAGSGCCPMSGAKKSAEKSGWDKCGSALSGIELTADQQEKVAAIEADCKKSCDGKKSCDDSMVKIREVLSEDQRVKFDAASGYGS